MLIIGLRNVFIYIKKEKVKIITSCLYYMNLGDF